MRRLTKIGVYDWTLEASLDALREAGVTLVLDVRQRRGVRGPDYAWANSQRLQAASALLCVERDPEAYHRSLIAARLAGEFGLPVLHLRPEG